MSTLVRRLLGYYRCPLCSGWSRNLAAHVWFDHGDSR